MDYYLAFLSALRFHEALIKLKRDGGSWYPPQHFQFRGKVVFVRFFELLRQELNEDFCEGALLSEELLVGSDFRDSAVLDHDDVVHFRQVRDGVSYLHRKERDISSEDVVFTINSLPVLTKLNFWVNGKLCDVWQLAVFIQNYNTYSATG